MTEDQAGLSVAGLLVSLLVLAGLAAVAVSASGLGSNGPTTGGVTLPASAAGSNPASGAQSGVGNVVGAAADVAARQNLETALSVIEQQGAVSGFSGLDPSNVQNTARGLRFITGPSPDDQDVSMASAPSPGSGSVALAARSASGDCFYVWVSGSATWFGVRSTATTCEASAMSSAPAPSSTGSGIDWRAGSFS